MKLKKFPRLLSISDCNWFILLENQETDVKKSEHEACDKNVIK